jgi:serine protease AprX
MGTEQFMKARSKTTSTVMLTMIAIVASLFAATFAPIPATASDGFIDVVVREAAPQTGTAEDLVDALGGEVGVSLEIIGGFQATVPVGAIPSLEANPSVTAVTPNAALQLLDDDRWEDDKSPFQGYSAWHAGYTVYGPWFMASGANGQGVDVALIDSGVVPVEGLTYPGKILNGPDLSFESQSDQFRYLDTYGHGTHMAGIIAGRDSALTGDPAKIYQRYWDESRGGFAGVAPGARVVSVKVAGHDGATDVSQVIAAIDWVVQHKNSDGLNIRVMNLSFGTDSSQPYALDPLAYAVEQAWNAGIVVVVAAGNDGNAAQLRNPALDPFVIAVGAADSNGSYRISDDYVTDFTSCGTTDRHVDVVAPGRSIRSLRAPGSTADTDHPGARVGDRFFKGSGTSQAAAVVSGAAALLVSQRPDITPDQVKAMFMDHAQSLSGQSSKCQGAGELNLRNVRDSATPVAVQTHSPSTGLGSLDAARGAVKLEADGMVLDGELDIFGNAFDPASWAIASANGTSWSAGTWNGTSWSGTSWSGTSWSGLSWTGTSWSGTSWSGLSWSGLSWSSQVWTGTSWSGTSWSGTSWSGTSWSTAGWLSAGWGDAAGGLRWD